MTQPNQETEQPYTVLGGTICDIEVAGNYVLAGFLEPDGTIRQFEHDQSAELRGYVDNKLLTGFNWNGYDSHMLAEMCNGASIDTLNGLSQALVNDKRHYANPPIPGIDLMPLFPKGTSLKLLGVRLGYPHLQELPFKPGATLSAEEIATTRSYNIHDLKITKQLYQELYKPLKLRQLLSTRYGMDLRSKSDAQIGEHILTSEYQKRTGLTRKDLSRMAQANNQGSVQYQLPSWWRSVDAGTVRDIGTSWAGLNTELVEKHKGDDVSFHLPTSTKSPYRRTIQLNDRAFVTGTGGLHSVDGPGRWQSDKHVQLVNIDVTSFYPATILHEKLCPRHLDNEFLSIFEELVSQRLKAKQEGDKKTADALKIIINAVYGKLGNWYSPWLDLQQQLQVVLTGQLALLLLIERLGQDRCANVLSGNTDGLLVGVTDSAKFTKVTACWEQETGYSLESNNYRQFAQFDVNDYIAITTDGLVTAKGSLKCTQGLARNPQRSIISEAIGQAIVENTPVGNTISACQEINSFISAGRTTKGHLEWRGQNLGKIARWYRCKQGDPIIVVQTNGKQSQLSGSEHSRPLPVLDGFPDDIDLDWYIEQATERLTQLRHPKHLGNNKAAHALMEESGLTIVSLWGGNKTPKGHSRTQRYRPEKDDFTSYDALGACTGQDVGIIALDIDYHDRLPEDFRALLKPTMVCQAVAPGSEYTFDAVARGYAKGKLFYRFNGKLPGKSHQRTLEQFGFEVFYKENIALLGQRQSDGYIYNISEHPIADLPDDIYAWLKASAYTKAQVRAAERGEAESSPTDTQPAEAGPLGALIAAHPELSDLNYDPSAWQGHGGLVGHCPAQHHDPGARDLLITTSQRGLVIKCLHETCIYVDAHQASLRATFDDILRQQRAEASQARIATATEQLTPSDNPVLAALQRPERQLLVLAPTGSGKTYAAARFALEEIAARRVCIYVAANKTDAQQFEDELIRLSTCANLAELGGHRLYRQDWSQETEGTSTRTPDLDTIHLVITHHTFLGRKGESQYFYGLHRAMAKTDREVTVIVDEVDAFIEQNLRIIDLDTRYKVTQRTGDIEPSYIPQMRCPAFTRSGNCEHCELEKDTLRWQVNSHQLLSFYNPNIKLNEQRERTINPTLRVDAEPTAWGQFEVQLLRQHPLWAESIDFTDELKIDPATGARRPYDPNQSLRSLIESAWRPRLFKARIVNIDGEQQYPARPCDIRTLALADKAPFKGLAPYRIRYLTASLTESQDAFLHDSVTDLETVSIASDQRKLAAIGVIIVDHPLSTTATLNLASEQRSLIITGYKRGLEQFDQRIPNRRVGLYSESSSRISIHDLAGSGPPDILVSYVGSSIARGINLPEYKTVIVDSASYRPTVATLAHELSEEGYRQAMKEETEARLTQAVGRILRHEPNEQNARRLIILHALPRDEAGNIVRPEKLIEGAKQRSETFALIETRSLEETTEALQNWLQGNGLEAQRQQATNRMSRRRRQMTRAERDAEKAAEKANKRTTKGYAATIDLINGKPWAAVRDAYNLRRAFPDKEELEAIKTCSWLSRPNAQRQEDQEPSLDDWASAQWAPVDDSAVEDVLSDAWAPFDALQHDA